MIVVDDIFAPATSSTVASLAPAQALSRARDAVVVEGPERRGDSLMKAAERSEVRRMSELGDEESTVAVADRTRD